MVGTIAQNLYGFHIGGRIRGFHGWDHLGGLTTPPGGWGGVPKPYNLGWGVCPNFQFFLKIPPEAEFLENFDKKR